MKHLELIYEWRNSGRAKNSESEREEEEIETFCRQKEVFKREVKTSELMRTLG